jgi:hypothetical protein
MSGLLLCLGCVRGDLFGFLTDSDRPSLYFNPPPGSYETPQRLFVNTQLRYSDWSIRYTTDAAAGYGETAKWKDYDPESGIVIFRTVHLRAVAFKQADGISGEMSGDYGFPDLSPQVFVDAAAASGGDGLSPETAFTGIQEGIDLAAGMYDGTTMALVKVMAGNYAGNISMKGGVILRGSYHDGWQAPGEPDPASDTSFNFPSTVILPGPATNEAAGTSLQSSLPWRTLDFPSGLSAPCAVEFCAVDGAAGGGYTAAAYSAAPLSGTASPNVRFRQCVLRGGDGTDASAGLWLARSGAAVDRCQILGRSGSFSGDSYGVLNIDSSLAMGLSWIDSGQGTWSGSESTLNNSGVYSLDDAAAAGSPAISLSNNNLIVAQGGYGVGLAAGILVSGGSAGVDSTANIVSGHANINSSMPISAALWSPSFPLVAGPIALSSGVLASAGSSLAMTRNSVYAGNASCPGGTGISAGLIADAGTAPGSRLNLDVSGNYRIRPDTLNNPTMSFGLICYGNLGSCLIRDNDVIEGGRGMNSTAVWLRPTTLDAPAIIERNGIYGGDSSMSSSRQGLYIMPQGDIPQPIIARNNIVHGGSGPSMASHGIVLDGSLSTNPSCCLWLLSNTVLAGQGANTYGIVLNNLQRSNVIDNIVDADSYTLVISGPRPDRLQNNCLYSDGNTDVCYSDLMGTADAAGNDYLTGAITPPPGWSDNFMLSPVAQFAGFTSGATTYPSGVEQTLAFDFRLAGGSILKVSGLDMSGEPSPAGYSTDFQNNARTAPWSIGAFE